LINRSLFVVYTMKKCNHCGKLKPENDFYWRWKSLGIRQPACKDCKSEQDRNWYNNRGEIQRSNVIRYKRDARAEAREFVQNYLRAHSCVDCGESNPILLEYDHVRGKKKDSIARLTSQGYSLGRIKKEISKCEVRCANCHH